MTNRRTDAITLENLQGRVENMEAEASITALLILMLFDQVSDKTTVIKNVKAYVRDLHKLGPKGMSPALLKVVKLRGKAFISELGASTR